MTNETKQEGMPSGILAQLRRRMPKRQLTATEAFRIAELQANVLLELAGLSDAPVDIDLLTSLPRIRLVLEHDLSVSGAALWSQGSWLVTLNADEPQTRQRYSAFHELKHIIDHPVVDISYAGTESLTTSAPACSCRSGSSSATGDKA